MKQYGRKSFYCQRSQHWPVPLINRTQKQIRLSSCIELITLKTLVKDIGIFGSRRQEPPGLKPGISGSVL